MKTFKNTIRIKYVWWRMDGQDIKESHLDALKEDAESNIFGRIKDEWSAGELYTNIRMDNGEGIEYIGWWENHNEIK